VRKSKLLIGIAVGLVVTAAGSGLWWWRSAPHAVCAGKVVEPDTREYKYVSLDKIVVMLHRPGGDSASHYLAMDLVFKVPAENEAATREQLPLLRSVAVRDLSGVTADDFNRLSIDELTRRINKAFVQSYPAAGPHQPFTEAMIGKLVVE
jgi:flagellar protein FliL